MFKFMKNISNLLQHVWKRWLFKLEKQGTCWITLTFDLLRILHVPRSSSLNTPFALLLIIQIQRLISRGVLTEFIQTSVVGNYR